MRRGLPDHAFTGILRQAITSPAITSPTPISNIGTP
jgi:hypothetical protein